MFGYRDKKCRSTAAHADRKRRPKWVPGVLRAIAGPPCPGGYKYGVLAHQDGRWTTVRQTVTVTKLTVRDPKSWPWSSQNGWNRQTCAVDKV